MLSPPSCLHVKACARSGVPSGGSDDFRVPCLAASILSSHYLRTMIPPVSLFERKAKCPKYFRKRTIVYNCVDLMAIGHSENRFPVNKLKRGFILCAEYSQYRYGYCDDKMNKFRETIRVIKNFFIVARNSPVF